MSKWASECVCVRALCVLLNAADPAFITFYISEFLLLIFFPPFISSFHLFGGLSKLVFLIVPFISFKIYHILWDELVAAYIQWLDCSALTMCMCSPTVSCVFVPLQSLDDGRPQKALQKPPLRQETNMANFSYRFSMYNINGEAWLWANLKTICSTSCSLLIILFPSYFTLCRGLEPGRDSWPGRPHGGPLLHWAGAQYNFQTKFHISGTEQRPTEGAWTQCKHEAHRHRWRREQRR